MYKVLKVSEEKISLGDTETKSLKIVQRKDCYEGISVGDHVDLFQNDLETIVSKSNIDVNKPFKTPYKNRLTSILTKNTLELSVKNIVIVSIIAAGFAIISSLFVENPSIASNNYELQAIIEFVKNDVESDDIVVNKKDFTFHHSTPYMIENGYPYKSFAIGKIQVKNSPNYDSANIEVFLNCTFDNDNDVFCYSSSSED